MPANYLTGYAPQYVPSGTNGASNALPSNYADIVAANTLARTRQVTTPGGQTFVTSDPNYSLNQYVQDTQVGNPFRKPGSVQDFATANGTPLSAQALHDYTSRYNDYLVSQHPNLQGVGGWMHNHPVGTIAAFIALAAGGAALSGAAGGGAAGGGAGGGAAGGGEAGLGLSGSGGLGSTVGEAAGGTFGGGSIGGGAAAGGIGGGAAGAGAAGGAGGLGIFANGGAGGMAGVGGGNAGALAGSGAIGGGAGVGGTTGGALGGFSGVANGISGAGGGSAAGGAAGGGSMGWGDWINLAGQAYGAYAQGQGAKNASNAQQAGLQAGIDEQRREFDLARGDQAPWLQAGTAALNRLNDPNGYTSSPDYNFVRNEALSGVQNSAAARGGLYSGNTARALEDRAAGVASQDYGNWFNRNASLAGIGQASAQSLGSLGQNNANNVSNLLSGQGNARASGIEGQTNALTGGISDFLSWYNRRRTAGGG